jgi:lipopolysaccharide export LptBFGC system permease protein LptF
MMNKRSKLTLLILSDVGAPVKQMTAPALIFAALLIFFTLSFITFGYVFPDYIHLKLKKDVNRQNLENVVSKQKESIENQQKQIEIFAEKINALKTNLVALNALENKIKTVADLKDAKDQKILFGVGGSIPEDLDTKHLVTNSHNNLLREMHRQLEEL